MEQISDIYTDIPLCWFQQNCYTLYVVVVNFTGLQSMMQFVLHVMQFDCFVLNDTCTH